VAVEIEPEAGEPSGHRAAFGELALLPFPESGMVRLRVTPERGFDAGAGRGKPVEARIHGGVVGLLVDTRGRQPFALPGDPAARIARLRAWNRALGVYPREV
jgi:hypothetical protein